jgi:phenylpropionate dioxygenase-like ring-hydroxylating dioxygenase large terminal subunit
MHIEDSAFFRKIWYAAMPVSELAAGPKPFTLLGEEMVLWMADGKVSALADHCCHRSARLSLGELVNGSLACPYHGWEFNTNGQCVRIPQMPGFTPPASACVKTYFAEIRYGFVWVAVEQPVLDIPELPEAADANFRLIQEFHEVWEMSVFRLVDNWFDLAHVAFVHRGSQGDITNPIPPDDQIEEFEFGLILRNSIPVANRAEGKRYTGIQEDYTVRNRTATWWVPNCRKLHLTFPNGLQHIIFTTATPIGPGKIIFTQFCMRNDTDQQISAADVIAHDRRVTLEDKVILESTFADVPIMSNETPEQGMVTDRSQMYARRKLRDIVLKYNKQSQAA